MEVEILGLYNRVSSREVNATADLIVLDWDSAPLDESKFNVAMSGDNLLSLSPRLDAQQAATVTYLEYASDLVNKPTEVSFSFISSIPLESASSSGEKSPSIEISIPSQLFELDPDSYEEPICKVGEQASLCSLSSEGNLRILKVQPVCITPYSHVGISG